MYFCIDSSLITRHSILPWRVPVESVIAAFSEFNTDSNERVEWSINVY